ncbi:flagellar protein FlaG [Galenea microaerophila]
MNPVDSKPLNPLQDMKLTQPVGEVLSSQQGAPSTKLPKLEGKEKSSSLSVDAEKQSHAKEKLDKEILQLNRKLAQSQSTLHFEKDDKSGRTVIKVIDRGTYEVIKQIPSDAFLEQSARIKAFLEQKQTSSYAYSEYGETSHAVLGLLLNKKV